jgi:hypothetical protein
MKQLILQTVVAQLQAVDYVNATNTVCNYAVSIGNTQLPDLVIPPAQYGDFCQGFAEALLHVLAWMDEVVPAINVIPTSFLSFNIFLQGQFTGILNNLHDLQTNPGDPTIIASIKEQVTQLAKEAAADGAAVHQLSKDIVTYQQNITPDSQNLNNLMSIISNGEQVDANMVLQLKGVLSQVQSLIDARNELATLNSLLELNEGIFFTGIGLGLGLIFVGPLGVIVGLGFGVCSAVFTTFAPPVIDTTFQVTVDSLQGNMNAINQQIGIINSTVGQLQALTDQINALVAGSTNASQKIAIVATFWDGIHTDLIDLVNDLDQVLADDGSGSTIAAAINDLQAAQQSWSDITGLMQQIAGITYTVVPLTTAPGV